MSVPILVTQRQNLSISQPACRRKTSKPHSVDPKLQSAEHRRAVARWKANTPMARGKAWWVCQKTFLPSFPRISFRFRYASQKAEKRPTVVDASCPGRPQGDEIDPISETTPDIHLIGRIVY